MATYLPLFLCFCLISAAAAVANVTNTTSHANVNANTTTTTALNTTSHANANTNTTTSLNTTSHANTNTAAALNTTSHANTNTTTSLNTTSHTNPNANTAATLNATFHANAATTATSSLIHSVCNHTRFFNICARTLSAEHASQTADTTGLAAITLRLAAVSARTTAAYISGLVDGTGEDSNMQQCLADCAENYTDAVDQLDDSVVAFDKKAYADVNTWVSAAMTDSDTCKSSCSAVSKNLVAQLLKRNEHFNRMCSIVLGVNSLLTK